MRAFLDLKPESFTWVILPVPYEQTTSFLKGTFHGPEALLAVSSQLETYDPLTHQDALVSLGIHTDLPVLWAGKLWEARERFIYWLNQGKRVVCLGGEHTLTPYLLSAYQKEKPAILHLDAHGDFRDHYDGLVWSHACAMRRVWEMGFSIHSLGLRAYCQEEAIFLKQKKIPYLHAWECHGKALEDFLQALPSPLHISLDADCLDPSIVPTVGTPEPGGLSFETVVHILRWVATHREVFSLDLVEILPMEKLDYGLVALNQLLRHFFCAWYAAHQG